MLMPKRVKRRKQFRGSMAGKLPEVTPWHMANLVWLLQNPAGSSLIRLRQPVLRLPVIPSVPVKYGLRFSPISP